MKKRIITLVLAPLLVVLACCASSTTNRVDARAEATQETGWQPVVEYVDLRPQHTFYRITDTDKGFVCYIYDGNEMEPMACFGIGR